MPTVFQDRSKENLPTNLVPLSFKAPYACSENILPTAPYAPDGGSLLWMRGTPSHSSQFMVAELFPQSRRLSEGSLPTAPSAQGRRSFPQLTSAQDGRTSPQGGILPIVPLPKVGDLSHSPFCSGWKIVPTALLVGDSSFLGPLLYPIHPLQQTHLLQEGASTEPASP